MAIKLQDGTVLRNLEEQVQYLTDYHDVNQGLAQWGIRVVGQVATAAELPEPYNGEYGDAIAVGEEAPFNFYIWTRASIEGNPAYWFPFGEISIVGPQGPAGAQGEKGDPGETTMWYFGSSVPNADLGREGDLYLRDDGMIWKRGTRAWQAFLYIKGAQGPQGIRGPIGEQGIQGPAGPAGPQGDVGGFINIWGTLTSSNLLPSPASLNNLTVAYLVEHTGGTDQANDHYDLYIQVGETSATAVWTNAGPFNAATLVTQGGVGLNVWDSDTKLDKPEKDPGGHMLVPAITPSGDQTTMKVSYSQLQYSLVPYQAGGRIKTNAPQDDLDAVNKQYADNNFVAKQTGITFRNQAYVKTSAGVNQLWDIDADTSANTIVRHGNNGSIKVLETPTENTDATSKAYVDNNFVAKQTAAGALTSDASGNVTVEAIATNEARPFSIVKRSSNGVIYTGTPTENNHAATKAYVDSKAGALYAHEFVWDETVEDDEGDEYTTEHTIIFYTPRSTKYTYDRNDVYSLFDNLLPQVVSIKFLDEGYEDPYYNVTELNPYDAFDSIDDEYYMGIRFKYGQTGNHDTGAGFGKTLAYYISKVE